MRRIDALRAEVRVAPEHPADVGHAVVAVDVDGRHGVGAFARHRRHRRRVEFRHARAVAERDLGWASVPTHDEQDLRFELGVVQPVGGRSDCAVALHELRRPLEVDARVHGAEVVALAPVAVIGGSPLCTTPAGELAGAALATPGPTPLASEQIGQSRRRHQPQKRRVAYSGRVIGRCRPFHYPLRNETAARRGARGRATPGGIREGR